MSVSVMCFTDGGFNEITSQPETGHQLCPEHHGRGGPTRV